MGYRLARNHPLPDDNKRAALLAITEFAERNGRAWRPLDEDDTVDTLVQVAAGAMSEESFIRWVSQQLAQPWHPVMSLSLDGEANDGPIPRSTWRVGPPPRRGPEAAPQQLNRRGRPWRFWGLVAVWSAAIRSVTERLRMHVPATGAPSTS